MMNDLHPMPQTSSDAPAARSVRLPDELLLKMHGLMLETRVLEERLVRMQKQGDGYFWIGGPGEEAFNVSLGLLLKKGRGLDHDFTHLHYRSNGTVLAMGGESIDALRQMAMRATDPFSGGRNFVGHASARRWNLCPISSPIEVQYSIAIGTAMAQRKPGCKGISVVQGGDAGSAEGDFATCLIWSSRPGQELPLLIIVTNNGWGISTAAHTQHAETNIADRAHAFGIAAKTINGNDPEEAYHELAAAMRYVREERRPFLLEAKVSRLYGHSSSSGANFVESEVDCLAVIERRLHDRGLRGPDECTELREELYRKLQDATRAVRKEPVPTPQSVSDHVFATHDLVAEGVERSVHPRTEGN